MQKEDLIKEYCEIYSKQTGIEITHEQAHQEMKQYSLLANLLYKNKCKQLLIKETMNEKYRETI
jgi:hypothetical protein